MIDPDRVIGNALNATTLPAYDLFFRTVTWLGEAYLWLALLIACVVLGHWRKIAAVLIIAILFSMVVNEDIKGIVQRPRPNGALVAGYFSVHSSYSFPSGHTQTAFVIAAVLAAFIARRYNLVTYLLATTVGMSRIYLGVHYFTDVVAGAAAGTLLGLLAIVGLYRYGLAGKSRRPVTGRLKEGIVILSAGYLAGMGLLLAGQYRLSIAAVIIAYIILLSRATYTE